jgi:hypothetical protein
MITATAVLAMLWFGSYLVLNEGTLEASAFHGLSGDRDADDVAGQVAGPLSGADPAGPGGRGARVRAAGRPAGGAGAAGRAAGPGIFANAIRLERVGVPLRRRRARAERCGSGDPPRRGGRAGGAERGGEEHARGPAAALPRPGRGPDHAGRRGSARSAARELRVAVRDRDAGDHPVPRHGARQHRLRHGRRAAGAVEAAARAANAARFHPRDAAGLRHGARRAGRAAVRRAAAAHRDRPGAAAQPADPDPGRGDQRPRHGERAAGAARDRRAARRPHGSRDRAPPFDRAACRPDPGARPRAASSERGTHEQLLAMGGLYHRLYHLQFASGSEAPVPT